MHLPHTQALDHSTDRRDEFAAVVAAVLPQTSQVLDTLARYILAAALWGLIAYLALSVLVS